MSGAPPGTPSGVAFIFAAGTLPGGEFFGAAGALMAPPDPLQPTRTAVARAQTTVASIRFMIFPRRQGDAQRLRNWSGEIEGRPGDPGARTPQGQKKDLGGGQEAPTEAKTAN